MSLLAAAIAILFTAAALGTAAACWHGMARPGPPWTAGAVHGLAGVAGFGILLIALRAPPRGVQEGGQAFGEIGAVLIAAALVVALGVIVARVRRRRVPALLLGLHATLAIMGLVMAAMYLSMPI